MQNEHMQSIFTFFKQLDQFCESRQLSTQELEDLKEILLAKRKATSTSSAPGLFAACSYGHIQIVESFFSFIQDLSASHS